MPSIFKRGGRKAKGGYYVAWYERPGLRKTVYAGHDLAAAQALARKLEADAMLRRKGVIDERAERWGAAEAKPLAEHLADFGAVLRARGNTETHASHTMTRATRTLGLAKAGRVSDLTPSSVQAALRDLRATGLSLATCNAYLRAAKSFSRWLWRDARAREDSLAPLAAFKITDGRRERRVLSDVELLSLMRAAHDGPAVLGMAGRDRAMLYALAVGTGLRAGELRSLTSESFDLDGAPPTVAVEAAYTKHRRRDVQPLPRALADALGQWLVGKEAGRPVFNIPGKTAKMLRVDLDAAGLPYVTAEGIADFHALRHAYITRLVLSGVNPKVCQELARHSDPKLTLNVYSHVGMEDKATALTMLPALAAPAGTADRTAYGPHGRPCPTVPTCHDGAEGEGDESGSETPRKARIADSSPSGEGGGARLRATNTGTPDPLLHPSIRPMPATPTRPGHPRVPGARARLTDSRNSVSEPASSREIHRSVSGAPATGRRLIHLCIGVRSLAHRH